MAAAREGDIVLPNGAVYDPTVIDRRSASPSKGRKKGKKGKGSFKKGKGRGGGGAANQARKVFSGEPRKGAPWGGGKGSRRK